MENPILENIFSKWGFLKKEKNEFNESIYSLRTEINFNISELESFYEWITVHRNYFYIEKNIDIVVNEINKWTFFYKFNCECKKINDLCIEINFNENFYQNMYKLIYVK